MPWSSRVSWPLNAVHCSLLFLRVAAREAIVRIDVSLAAQTLKLLDDDGKEVLSCSVSTAKNGAGERNGSNCTPRGRHVIRAKIGAGQAPNTVFVGRRPTGELWTPQLQERFPTRDWILTRILWLSGCEPGRNRL